MRQKFSWYGMMIDQNFYKNFCGMLKGTREKTWKCQSYEWCYHLETLENILIFTQKNLHEEKILNFFCRSNDCIARMWQFFVKNLHYFEDFIIHFNKNVIVENDTLEVYDYYH